MSREQRLFDWEGSNPPSSAGLLRRPYRTDVAGEALIDGLAVVTVVFLVASLVAGALLALVGAAGQGANWLAGGGLLSGMAFGGRLSAAAGRPPFVERLDVSAMPGLLLVLAVALAAVVGLRSERRRPSRSARQLRGRALLTGVGALVAEVLLVLGTRGAGAFASSDVLQRAGVPLPSVLLGALTLPGAANLFGRLAGRLRDAPWLRRSGALWDRWQASVLDVAAFWVASGVLAVLAGLGLVLASPAGIQGLPPAALGLPFDAGVVVLLGAGASLETTHAVEAAGFGAHFGALRSHELGLVVGGLGLAGRGLFLVPVGGLVLAGVWLGRRRDGGAGARLAWARAGRAAALGALVAFVVAAVGSVSFARSSSLGLSGVGGGVGGSWSWALSEWQALVAGGLFVGATSLLAPVVERARVALLADPALPRLRRHRPGDARRFPAESPLAMAEGQCVGGEGSAQTGPRLEEPNGTPTSPVGARPAGAAVVGDLASATGRFPATTELPVIAPPVSSAPAEVAGKGSTATLGELATTWHGGRGSPRRRWLMWSTIVLGVLAAAALAGFLWVRHQERLAYSPAAAAQDYLGDLAAGRVTAAMGLAATSRSGVLLDHTAFAAERANGAISHVVIGRAVVDASRTGALVPVRFELGGATYHDTLHLVRGATVDLVLHRWALEHATVRLVLPANVGAPLLVDGQEVPAGSTVRVLPGLVRIGVGRAGWLDAQVSGANLEADGLVEAVRPGETLHLGVSLALSSTGRAGAEALVSQAFDRCLASTSLTPSGCPFGDQTFVPFGASSVRWSAERPLFHASAPATFEVVSARRVVVSGTYRVRVRYRAAVPLFGSRSRSATLEGPFVAEVGVPSEAGGTGSVSFLGTGSSGSAQAQASTAPLGPSGGPGGGFGKNGSPGPPGRQGHSG